MDAHLAWQDVPVHSVARQAVPPTARAVTRRGLLRGAAAAAGLAAVAVTSGCDLLGGGPVTPPPVTLPPELVALLNSASALADAYDSAIANAPSLTATLSGPRDAHREHVTVLAEAYGGPTPSPTAIPSLPTDPGGIIATLAQAETAGRDLAREACLVAPARLAPLVGSIAAARACHLEVLQ